MIEMKKSAFIISKPFQYINASNIEDLQTKDCFIIDNFYDAEKFTNLVREYSNNWNDVQIYKNNYKALDYIIKNKSKYSKVYIDSDFGVILSFYLNRLKAIDLYTYEEGYASYNFIRNKSSVKDRIKWLVSDILGLKNWVGGHSKTKGMYLYQPEMFVKKIGAQKGKEIKSFSKPISDHMFSLKEIAILFDKIDFTIFKDKKVLLYMTNYHININVSAELESNYKDYKKVLKPHPQMGIDKEFFELFDYVVENYLPAEILIQRLLTYCSDLTILHEGSFALEYFKEDKKMKPILLSK